MKSFSSFLEKFKSIKDPKEERQKIANILTTILGKEIKTDQILITKDILSINASNYLKTEIFMKREELLATLKEKRFNISDIR